MSGKSQAAKGATKGLVGVAKRLAPVLRDTEEVVARHADDVAKKAAQHADDAARGAGNDLPGLTATRSQIEAKFKHAGDFGVTESRGAAGFDAYAKAVETFVGDPSTVRIAGLYRHQPAILNYNPTSRLVVVQSLDGAFHSGWKMSAGQLHNVVTKGSLGGG